MTLTCNLQIVGPEDFFSKIDKLLFVPDLFFFVAKFAMLYMVLVYDHGSIGLDSIAFSVFVDIG